MISACEGRSDRRSDGQTESIIAKTALCIASYADALSKTERARLQGLPKFMRCLQLSQERLKL